MAKEVPLSQGQVALVDDDDYKWLNKHKWHALWAPSIRGFYARRAQWDKKRKQYHFISMARVIMRARLGQQVDHISGGTLDNRKANLRLCTAAENSYNQKPVLGGSSRYKGVTWNIQHRKWHVRIGYEGRRVHLGYFVDEDDAASAYNRAAVKYFGEFARLNAVNQEVVTT